MFAATEVGGAPAMLYGLVGATQRREPPPWLDVLAAMSTLIGIGLSTWHLQGFNHPLPQTLEFCGGLGFLAGTLLLAKDNRQGYGFFLLMGASTGLLFLTQEAYLLAGMQVLSICFVLDGMRQSERFQNVPQVRDLEDLVNSMLYPGATWYIAGEPWPCTARLWNGYLVTYERAGNSNQPVDFVGLREPQQAEQLLPIARKLAEEGRPAFIKLPSSDPFLAREGCVEAYLWTRRAVTRKL